MITLYKNKTCCFTGHRPMRLPFGFEEEHPLCIALKKLLKREIQKKIEQGCIDFITGAAWGVDIICAEIVLELKKQYPEINLICVIPHEEQATKWNEEYRTRYFGIIDQSDDMILISYQYTPTCFHERNRYMVDNAMHVIAVYNGNEKGGTSYTIEYARKKGRNVTVINSNDLTVEQSDNPRTKFTVIRGDR